MTQRITIQLAYEVDDEIALREAAEALAGFAGGVTYNAGDAAMRILSKEAAPRLALPGCRGPEVTREFEGY